MDKLAALAERVELGIRECHRLFGMFFVYAWRIAIGAWRSLVAHYFGVVGVVGSNPAAPIHLLAASGSLFCWNSFRASISLLVMAR